MREAVITLRDVMRDGMNPPAARVSAARTLLETGFKVIEVSDIIQRIEVLEGVALGKGNTHDSK